MPSWESEGDVIAAGATAFATTHWSVVLAAADGDSQQADSALEQLCRTYWPPLYAFLRREGRSEADAQDLVQGFFASFLARPPFARLDREQGKFRSFLLASLKHFLANEWDRAHARKRGGGQRLISIDALDLEERYGLEPASGLSADKVYDRTWALTLLEQARAVLRAEFAASGRAERFETLEQFLPGEEGTSTYAEIAGRLGVAEGTIKSDVSRLRRRYGELLRAEVANTVGSMTDLDDELRHLMEALS